MLRPRGPGTKPRRPKWLASCISPAGPWDPAVGATRHIRIPPAGLTSKWKWPPSRQISSQMALDVSHTHSQLELSEQRIHAFVVTRETGRRSSAADSSFTRNAFSRSLLCSVLMDDAGSLGEFTEGHANPPRLHFSQAPVPSEQKE